MKECNNNDFNLGDIIYFTTISDTNPYIVKYQVNEKLLTHNSISYKCGAVSEQDDPKIIELLQKNYIPKDIQVCGNSIFKNKKDSININIEHFKSILKKLKKLI